MAGIPEQVILPLEQFKSRGKERPTMKDIENHVVMRWAPQWKQLAIQLNIDQCLINIIQHDHGKDCIECCSRMLGMWLEQNTHNNATWDTLIEATDNLPIDLTGIGTDILSTVSDATKRLQGHYVSSRFSSSVDEWPPYQPKHYTTLAFIHNKGKRTDAVRFSVTEEFAVAGKIDTSCLYKHTDLNANMTKNISDIFLPAESSDRSFVDLHVLIEGAPGIGKTVLSKEIAYLWAKKEILISKNLLLLVFLRECHQKTLRSIEGLVQHVFKSSEMTAHLTSYLSKTDGKNAIIIFDGYDELTEENKKESIIVDIISRRILTKCCLVITSRPTASSHLHSIVDCRVEVVGFTEEDRLDYIQTALENCDEQVKDLQHYLQSNPTINALCYIPLNMTILLCLAENGIDRLPKTQTEMYRKFIEMTIVRFIRKYENCNTVINIGELAHPHDKLFIDLAKLAYEALKTDKIVFTLHEIKEGCPHLTTTSSNWNGLGLLKAVQYFSPEMGNDQVTFHFLHFSVQEYLAAWYISLLPDRKQIKLLNKTFWELRYYNTWIMYVGITCGSSFALRHFLSGNRFQLYSKLFKSSKVSNKYLKHKMKCLHLFQCLVEASKEGTVESMKQLFQNNQIDLSNQTLLPSDLNTLGFFLIRSINKEWNVLNLSNCNIGENGSNILCDRFLDKDARSIVTIKMVNFSYNQLKFSSLMKLFDLFTSWHTSEIIITDNAIHDNMTDIKEIENIILQSSMLTLVFIGTYLFSRNLRLSRLLHGPIPSYTTNIRSIYLLNCTSDSEIMELLTLLKKQKLDKVRIIGSTLDKSFIKTMASLLLHNNDCVNMFVYDPTMSDEIADDISSLISSSNKDVSGVMLIVSSGRMQGFVNTHTLSNELSALELFNLSLYIRYLNTDVCLWKNNLEIHNNEIIYNFVELLYKVDFSWNLKIVLQENNTLIVHKETFKSLYHMTNENTSVIYLSYCEFECGVISEQYSTLHIFNSPDYVELLHANLLHNQSVPNYNELFIYGNIKYSLINSLIELWLYDNYNISAVLVANDLIVAHHPNTRQIALAFRLQPLVTTLILSTTNNVSVFYQVIDIVTLVNTKWSELDLTGCNVSDSEYEIMYRTIRCSTVRKLNISFNKLSVLGIPYLVRIVLIWGVKKLSINGNNDVLYDCLIENLLSGSKHEVNFFISITYNNKTIYIVCNTSQNEIITKAKGLVSELYIMNCGLKFNSTEIISYLNTTHNLWRLCINSATVSEAFVMEILKLFSNKAIQLTISNVKIIGDDGMICNLITSKGFYCDISSLVISTDHWLCVYNVLKYQLHLIHQYFMNKTQEDCYGMALVRKLMQINGDKLYIFEKDLVKLIRLFGKVPQAIGGTQIIAALSNTTSLKTIEIDNYSFTTKTVDNLTNILHCNTQLQELSLNGNGLQPSDVTKIAKALCGGIQVCNESNINTDDSTNYFIADIATRQECNNSPTGTIVTTEAVTLPSLVTLTKLSISNNNITDEAADDIATAISCNIHLQELNLSHNDLQASGAIKIARSLQKLSSLIKLYINHNNISHEAADDIAAAISSNVCLQELNLGSNHLQALGAIKIGKALQSIVTLTKWYIYDNNITHNAADDIAAVISCNNQIEELDISRNDLQVVGIKKIAKKLHCICTLKKLHINNNNINDEAVDDIAAAVSHNNDLQEIDISGNYLQTIGIIKIAKAFQKISSLKNLYLRNSGITYEAAVHVGQVFKRNTHLQQLDFGKNNFKSSGAIKITALLHCITTLTKLCLSNNNISSVASGCIAAAISCNTQLQEFDISVNSLKTSGVVKIAKALQSISTLTKLYINDNNITHEAADDIAAAISCNIHLQEFDIGKNNLEAVGAIKVAKALQNISTLTKLCINSNKITHEAADDIAAAISCNIHLQEFDIGRNNLQTVGAIKIAKCLQNILTVTKLNVSDNNITDEAADDIATAISCNVCLQEIDISINHLKTSGAVKIAKALQTISTLTKLYINDNNVTHEAADDIAAAISCNVCLQEIDISKSNLRAVGAIKIAKRLQYISKLTKLYINHNKITDEAADYIVSAICSNVHLQEFDIGGNDLAINHINVAKSLQNTSTLTKLYIYDYNITNEAATDIAAVISSNSQLKQLDISINKLCGLGTVIISKALQTISTLTKLYMDNNKITDEAADDIAAAIISNNGLEEFSIGANNLKTSGAIIIAKGLQKISTLAKLYINNNQITDEAADDIAGAILCNSNLKEFDIGKNYLQSSGAIKIARSLQKISSLIKLHIDHNNITDEALVDIAAVTCYNPGVQVRLYGNKFGQAAAIKFSLARYHIISENPLGNINYLTSSNAESDTDSDTVSNYSVPEMDLDMDTVSDYSVPNMDLETDTISDYSVPDMDLDTENPI